MRNISGQAYAGSRCCRAQFAPPSRSTANVSPTGATADIDRTERRFEMAHRREHEDPSQVRTLLLVHGAFDGAWVWEPVLDPLRRRGVRVEAIERLPSAGTDPSALGDLGDDAEHVRARVDQIAGPVVLCGHSYGGMVITQLADHPAVTHSVYLAALWPGEDQSASDLLGGGLPDWVVDRGDGSFAVSEDVEAVRQALFADLDPVRAADAHARMVLQSAASAVAPSGGPSRLHPTTYVLCSEDQVLPLELQEAMAAAADHTVRLHSAHCPQLSCPEQLADVLAETVVGSPAGRPVA
jgi:pimeloyl-ACP methyl ester carboxylesterase